MKYYFFLLFFAVASMALSTELSFPKDLDKFEFQNVYELNKLKQPLSVWRRAEVDKNYKECNNKAPGLINKNKLISGWILTVWAQCVYKASEYTFDQKTILVFLDNVKIHQTKILNGPWKNQMLNLTHKIILQGIGFLESDNPNKKDRFKSRLIGVLETDEAFHNVEIRKWYQTHLNNNQPSMNVVDKKKAGISIPESSEVSAVEKVLTLDDFAKGDWDKSLIQVEPVWDSLKATYRKMDYRKLAVHAPGLEKYFKNSELFRDYSMLMGRTYQFLGEYVKSLEYFQNVLTHYPESMDFEEALFRSGLVSLRMKENKKAQNYFERLIQLDRERYDITGRYWWLRSLEYNKDSRELEEKSKFASDFPFSYFGLRITAEINGNKIRLPKGEPLAPIKWVLTGKNRETWQRFIKLSELGWVLEAQAEMQSFVWPTNPLKVYYISMVLSKANLHPLSVRNVTPLLETYSDVRSLNAIKDLYPKSYLSLILKEKPRYSIHEHLILSLIRQESSFGLKALSTSQAAGLMQMIQPTALEVADKLKMKIEFPDDLYRPEVNVPMGVFYIHQVIKEMNFHVPLGLASYNAGPHKVRQFINFRDVTKKMLDLSLDKDNAGLEDLWIDELPWSETTGYVKSILRNMLIYDLIAKDEIQFRPDFWRDFILK